MANLGSSKPKRGRGRPRKHPLPKSPALSPSPEPSPKLLRITEAEAAEFSTGSVSSSTEQQPEILPPTPGADRFEQVAATIEAKPDPGDSEVVVAGDPEILRAVAPPVLVTEAAVRPWIDLPFKIMVKIWGDKYGLEEYEREAFVQTVTPAINRYVPDFIKMTGHPELWGLALVVLAYSLPRSDAFADFMKFLLDKFGGNGSGGATVGAPASSS